MADPVASQERRVVDTYSTCRFAIYSGSLSFPYPSCADTEVMRRGLVIAAGWVGAVVAAAAFGITTVSALGAGSTASGPLSQQQVSDRLTRGSAVPPPSATAPGQPTTGPSATTSPTVYAARQYFTTSGGSLWATCTGGQATVDTMTPRQGYRLDSSDKGPATTVWVQFKQDSDHGHNSDYHVTVTCVGGVPQVRETTDS
jgi:hypothetical protein